MYVTIPSISFIRMRKYWLIDIARMRTLSSRWSVLTDTLYALCSVPAPVKGASRDEWWSVKMPTDTATATATRGSNLPSLRAVILGRALCGTMVFGERWGSIQHAPCDSLHFPKNFSFIHALSSLSVHRSFLSLFIQEPKEGTFSYVKGPVGLIKDNC